MQIFYDKNLLCLHKFTFLAEKRCYLHVSANVISLQIFHIKGSPKAAFDLSFRLWRIVHVCFRQVGLIATLVRILYRRRVDVDTGACLQQL